jgi:hypothetical protein
VELVVKAALGQVFSQYFGFPCQSSVYQILHHHKHPVLVRYAYWRPQCRVDPIELNPPLYQLKKLFKQKLLLCVFFSMVMSQEGGTGLNIWFVWGKKKINAYNFGGKYF